jgi:tetratricopeptide (TPR) repeat protein
MGIRILMLISILLIGGLYFGNFTTKKPDEAVKPTSHSMPEGIGFEEYERRMMAELSSSDKRLFNKLSSTLQTAASATEQSAAAHELAHAWEERGNRPLTAYYHFIAAEAENNAEELVAIGDSFTVIFRQLQDTLIKNNLLTFALRSYEAALERRPDDLNLKVKVGSMYVEGSGEPMKGIALLREVVDQDPQNIPALTMLGRFSILSGQYDKAKQHLDKVLVLDPNNAEAIYFMAITQEGLGNFETAVSLLEACKRIVNNPDFDAEIDGTIEELKNKIK